MGNEVLILNTNTGEAGKWRVRLDDGQIGMVDSKFDLAINMCMTTNTCTWVHLDKIDSKDPFRNFKPVDGNVSKPQPAPRPKPRPPK